MPKNKKSQSDLDMKRCHVFLILFYVVAESGKVMRADQLISRLGSVNQLGFQQ